jgi:hypothetical protein
VPLPELLARLHVIDSKSVATLRKDPFIFHLSFRDLYFFSLIKNKIIKNKKKEKKRKKRKKSLLGILREEHHSIGSRKGILLR